MSHRLALALGIPVSELLDRIDSAELLEWAAFEKDFGPLTVQERVDHAAALVGLTLARTAGSDAARYEDFLGWTHSDAAPAEQSIQEQMAVMRSAFAQAAAVKRSKRAG